jgi:hypothetical protein
MFIPVSKFRITENFGLRSPFNILNNKMIRNLDLLPSSSFQNVMFFRISSEGQSPKLSNPECYTLLSEHFRTDLYQIIWNVLLLMSNSKTCVE